MITQFHIFITMVVMQIIFKHYDPQTWENREWYVLVIALTLNLLVFWICAGWLVEPVNIILKSISN